jgi:hypothetical protein
MYIMEMKNDSNDNDFWTQSSWGRLVVDMQDNMKEKEMSPCMQFGNLTEKNSLTTTYLYLPRPI